MSQVKLLVLALTLVTSGCVTDELPVDVSLVPGDGPGNLPNEDMVELGGVTFMMGCNTDVDTECDADESPYHSVSVAGFFIHRTEVTQEMYGRCVDDGACGAPSSQTAPCSFEPVARAKYPATCVTHSQAQAYCTWIGGRLPTEAEWERASRGTTGGRFPWGNEAADCTRAHTSECGTELVEAGTLEAGATPEGIMDLAGNAFEWVADWYEAAYYQTAANDNPTGPPSSSLNGRVIRSGSVAYPAKYARVSNRGAQLPNELRFTVGFRCVRGAPPLN